MARRVKGEGTFENVGDQIRHVRKVNGKRTVGPLSATRKEALTAFEDKLKRLAKEAAEAAAAEQERERPKINDLIFERLAGPWKRELAPATMELYMETVFPIWVDRHWIGGMEPDDVDKDTLRLYREDLYSVAAKTTRDKKAKKITSVSYSGRRKKDRNSRTVERYEALVHKLLKELGNHAPDDLNALKKEPVKVHWLKKAEREPFLEKLKEPCLQRAAKVCMHGIGASEASGLTWDQYDGQSIDIDRQDQVIRGERRTRSGLKRERRYRSVPVADFLKKDLDAIRGRGDRILLTQTGKQWNRHTMRQAMLRALKESKWEGITPHDLRRSGGKWMLDAGAKLNDVADILGNDVKVLLLHYDQSDAEGKRKAVENAF